MKKFVKGDLETIVEDNDRRIPAYIAHGWKETELPEKTLDECDKQLNKAIDDVVESEGTPSKKNRKKPTKKVNDAIKATTTAATESEAVDDGLLKKEGE